MEILITIIVFAICFAAMGVGLWLKGQCLRGSCGGESVRLNGVNLSCSSCPKRNQPDSGCTLPTEQETSEAKS